MKLSPQQLKEFDALGYVFMPGCFAEEEVATLRGGSRGDLQDRAPGGVAREDRRAANGVRGPYL